MPYMVIETVATMGGASHARGHVVSDARGKEILAEHPAAATQIVHDDDLCGAMVDQKCDHESHAWSKPASNVVQLRPAAPSPAAPSAAPEVNS